MPRPFGSDRLEAGSDGRVRLACRRPKTWHPRRPAGPGVALHPGTAIRWEDDLWEVLSAEETRDGGARYELAPWDERHAIRLLLPYDETSEAEREADRRDAGRRRAAGKLVLLASPVVGLLPGRVQERLAVELGLRGATLTLASAFAPLAVGTFALLMTVAAGVGAGVQLGGPAVTPLMPLLIYFMPESFLRIAVAMSQERPVGSLLGVPLYLLGRLAGLVAGPEALPAAATPAEGRRLGDRFLMLEPLLSFLPAADQRRLAQRHAFAPLTWGRRTAWLLLVYPGFTAPAQAYALASRGASFSGLLLLLATTALAAEQVARLRALGRGEPAPSVLGALVKPFAAPLLR